MAGGATTRQHIDLLTAKYHRLGEAMEEAFGQLLEEVAREAPTPSEQLELWQWARALPFPGSSTRMAKALGQSVTTFVTWRNSGAPNDRRRWQGEFPIGTQLTPRRGQPCVYGLLVGARVVYVGMSGNVRARLKQHWKNPDRDGITGWQAWPCATMEEASALEGDLIYQHQPVFNVAGRARRRAR